MFKVFFPEVISFFGSSYTVVLRENGGGLIWESGLTEFSDYQVVDGIFWFGKREVPCCNSARLRLPLPS